jgi:class 3 adenylate cyclase
MEPSIQYAQTKDGVSIAYWTMGEGMPVVVMPNIPFGHIQYEWQIPEYREWYQRLAQTRRLIRYDSRGQGLSDRDVTEYSIDTWLLDLEAAVDHLGLESFALFAPLHSGPVAIVYAARHPQRVSHLLLWFCYARSSDYLQSPQLQTLRSLINQDWELYTETVAHAVLGWSEGEAARRFAAMMRDSVTPEAAQAVFGATVEFDVAALLPQLKCPTLVLHRRQYPVMSVNVARHLASHIPNARLAMLEGTSAGAFLGDTESVLSAIDEFLSEGEEEAAAEPPEPGAFRTVLFTDVEGSTALTDRLGDAKARKLLREHERMIREALKAHAGSEVKTMGDGFMASFSSATKALKCAIAMQRAFAERNESAEEPIKVRIGLNAGEPIAEDDPDGRSDLFGTAVILAARIAAKAEGGEILASEAVRQIVAGKKFPFSDRGETALRGFEDRVHIYQVSWREA